MPTKWVAQNGEWMMIWRRAKSLLRASEVWIVREQRNIVTELMGTTTIKEFQKELDDEIEKSISNLPIMTNNNDVIEDDVDFLESGLAGGTMEKVNGRNGVVGVGLIRGNKKIISFFYAYS